jgi:hypothetical protein
MPLMGKSEKRESGALSARRVPWQLPESEGGRRAARHVSVLAAVLLTALAGAPAGAVPGGDVETLPLGDYVCELPGDAGGAWRIRQPAEDFTVVTGSNYEVDGRRGSYLLTGDDLVMTSGPHDGKRYHRQSRGLLRRLGEDGKPGELRCVRSTHNNS